MEGIANSGTAVALVAVVAARASKCFSIAQFANVGWPRRRPLLPKKLRGTNFWTCFTCSAELEKFQPTKSYIFWLWLKATGPYPIVTPTVWAKSTGTYFFFAFFTKVFFPASNQNKFVAVLENKFFFCFQKQPTIVRFEKFTDVSQSKEPSLITFCFLPQEMPCDEKERCQDCPSDAMCTSPSLEPSGGFLGYGVVVFSSEWFIFAHQLIDGF